ncbi:hypothetical protein [Brucella sp. NBRC 12950]|uniref:hypothetical protein n=1 Tax=Brucella sp. NBRC 12950 TaxID=2994518 RepID=UPI0025576296|nr:hypothetical protein [Brucella sp. NBRC 12950]
MPIASMLQRMPRSSGSRMAMPSKQMSPHCAGSGPIAIAVKEYFQQRGNRTGVI